MAVTPAVAEPVVADQKTVAKLVQKIATLLQQGWTVSFEYDDLIEIERTEPVAVNQRNVANPPPLGPGEAPKDPPRESVGFGLRVVPYLTVSGYRRLGTENAELHQKISSQYELLSQRRMDQKIDSLRMSQKFDNFWPVTDGDKIAVETYEALKRSVHALPDFYFEDISLTSEDSSAKPVDSAIRAELEQTRGRIVALLSSYPGAHTPDGSLPEQALDHEPSRQEIGQKRDLEMYDDGGDFSEMQMDAEKMEDLRSFIWSHWTQRKRGFVRFKVTGIDTASNSHIFIEPDENGGWTIAWRVVSTWNGGDIVRRTLIDLERIVTVERAKSVSDSYGRLYVLVFRSKEGKEVRHL